MEVVLVSIFMLIGDVLSVLMCVYRFGFFFIIFYWFVSGVRFFFNFKIEYFFVFDFSWIGNYFKGLFRKISFLNILIVLYLYR